MGSDPAEPTGDQHQVINAIFQTLADRRRLYALIQGDVGCGKTIVGLAAAYLFSKAGYQSALLCPTSVLATQHAEVAKQLLEPLGTR